MSKLAAWADNVSLNWADRIYFVNETDILVKYKTALCNLLSKMLAWRIILNN